jgi:peptidoglycan hydrolase-like protein with peptidoglycan-binding domain
MLAMVLLAWNADGATPTKKKAPVKKGATSASKGKKKAPAKKKSATTWRNRQLAPSTDRYREIQTALAGKGYLKPEDATGSWNTTSAEALKKFQSEQNLDASGKINSLSLIALGLGPKRESPAIPPPPPPQNH